MNTVTRETHEVRLGKLAFKKKISLKWNDRTVYVKGGGKSYSVCLIGNWPERVESRILWLAKQLELSL